MVATFLTQNLGTRDERERFRKLKREAAPPKEMYELLRNMSKELFRHMFLKLGVRFFARIKDGSGHVRRQKKRYN